MDHWRNQRRNLKIPGSKWKPKHNDTTSKGCSKSSSNREVYSSTSLPQETRKISNKNLIIYLEELEKEEQTKPKVSKGKESIKIREEISETETKKIEKYSLQCFL